jgi:hypothetical protein
LKRVIRKHESKLRDTENAETNTKTAPAPVAPSCNYKEDGGTNTSQVGGTPATCPNSEPTASAPDTQEQPTTTEHNEDVPSDPKSYERPKRWTAVKGHDSKPNLEPKTRIRSRLDTFKYMKKISTAGVIIVTIPDMDELDRVDEILGKTHLWSPVTDPRDSNIRYMRIGT